jgi:hypothetical protein
MRSEGAHAGGWKANLGLSLAVTVALLLTIEFVGRMLVVPSDGSYGKILGTELPPYHLRSPFAPPQMTDRSAWYETLIVDGRKITIGDLWGIARRDPDLGYAPKENTSSDTGWWQTNSLGARATTEFTRELSPGQTRILVFGDSFAVGSRLPHDETWSVQLDRQNDGFEVFNFGVDGYGMAQSYLRYQRVKGELDHDFVLLMFVPQTDLWRDINTRRDVGDSWPIYWVMPRFIISDGRLRLVPDPFVQVSPQGSGQMSDWDPLLRSHLRAYDRFYFASRYEQPKIAGDFLLYKLAASSYGEYLERRLRSSLFELDSEGMLVTKRIVLTMRSEVTAMEKDFILAFLPTERSLLSGRPSDRYWQRWGEMVTDFCQPGMICIDLAQGMRQASRDEIDKGYDGTHFGPRASRLIAGLIGKKLGAIGTSGASKLESD